MAYIQVLARCRISFLSTSFCYTASVEFSNSGLGQYGAGGVSRGTDDTRDQCYNVGILNPKPQTLNPKPCELKDRCTPSSCTSQRFICPQTEWGSACRYCAAV